MKNILNAIKSVFRGFDNKLNQIEKSIPNKLSDLENDLFYSNITEQLHLTLSDLTEHDDGTGMFTYEYSSEHGFDYLEDPNKFKVTLSFSCNGESHSYTQDDLNYRKSESGNYILDNYCYVEFVTSLKLINVYTEYNNKLESFDLRIYSREEKVIPSNAVEKMTGASSTEDGKAGIVPAPKAGQQDLPLCGDGQYKMLPQSDYTQNDSTKPDYIKNRPGGYFEEQKTYKLDISAVKQDGINELKDVSVIQDDFMHMSSINVEISHYSGTINRTLTQREIGQGIINQYGAQIYGNAHLISPSQPDTGEDMALYKQMDSQSSYSIGWHVWATSVPSGDVEVCVFEKTRRTVPFDQEFIPWYASPTANSVLYTAQSLTDAQKNQARVNIGAGTQYTLPEASSDALGGVKADAAETADTQPVRIGGDGKLYTAPGGSGEAVLYTAQSLTEAQQAQARTNIGAEKVLTSETWTFTLEDNTTVTKEVYVK